MMTLQFISGGEIIIVLLVILLLFGSKSIPDIARMLGKGMNEFRRASDEIKRELRNQSSDIQHDLNNSRSFIDNEVKSVTDAVREDIQADDYDPYKLAEGTEYKEGEPEVTSNKKNKPTDNQTESQIPSDGPISREDKIEE